jgi:hypothetical protein
MGRVGEVNIVFEQKDAAVAKVCYGPSIHVPSAPCTFQHRCY